MNATTLFRAEVAGTGMYVPEKRLTNADLEKMLDTSDEWIRTRTGIGERRLAAEEESSSTMGAQAGKRALASAGIEASDLDLIIVCTSTPDVLFPATACFIQKELGADRAAAFDLSAVCSGFVFGLSVAEQYLKSGRYRHILLIGSETNSRIVDWSDRTTCILFGDGAGAMVLKRTENEQRAGILSSHIYSDGEKSNLIQVPGGIGKTGVSIRGVEEGQYFIKMDGNATFKVAVQRMSRVCLEALEHNGLKGEDVTLMIPHQANKRIINAVAEKLNFQEDKVFVNIHKYGNTSAASIPIAVHEARECGKIQPGSVTLLGVVGAGLTWGASVIKW